MTLVLSPEGAAHVREHPELQESIRRMMGPQGFREFLNYWIFLNGDTGEEQNLGKTLWPAQEKFVSSAQEHNWVYFLKARQLGETTIECAYDAYVARIRSPNARVHLFSKREEEAIELLDRVKYGLDHLPTWLKLRVHKDVTKELVLDASYTDAKGDLIMDRRLLKAYPADKNPSRSATCNHAHLDEWTFTGDPRRVWQAVEPAAAGTVHFVTTSEGPTNFTSHFWKQCMAGDRRDRKGEPIYPCFIGALERPDRNAEWLKRKKAEDAMTGNWEYPVTWEEAISAGGDLLFNTKDVNAAGIDFRGLSLPQPGRKYAKGADIGRHADAAVIVVLDVTEDVHDVVYYKRMREATYPQIQAELENVHRAYRGPLGIEKNHAGEAVIENLHISEEEAKAAKFITSHASKARIISQLNLQLQNQLIKWDPEECEQLDSEIRGYQLPDDKIVQDSVIAIAIAEEYAPQAYSQGRASVWGW